MKTITTLAVFAALFTGALQAQNIEPVPIAGQYIVTLKESYAKPVVLQETVTEDREETSLVNQASREGNLSKLAQIRRSAGIGEEKVVAEFADALVGFTAILSETEVSRLTANPDVESVYPDYYMQLDPQEPETQSDGGDAGQTIPCAVTNAGGFKIATGNSWIWILDTGIDVQHADLNVSNLAPYAKSFIPGETYIDKNGHGTHVAGIAAAKNNSFGIVGVSAGALVVPVKVLSNSGQASMTYIIQGLNHVAMYDKVNDVVNLSLGAYPVSNCPNNYPALKTAILNLGVSGTWVCMASGNNGALATQCSPGCINGTRVFTVGGMTCNRKCFTASNWSPTVVDWVATGANVYSTYKNGGYATMSGTSQATPVVAGIIHARGGAPVTGGTISCGNQYCPPASYKIAIR